MWPNQPTKILKQRILKMTMLGATNSRLAQNLRGGVKWAVPVAIAAVGTAKASAASISLAIAENVNRHDFKSNFEMMWASGATLMILANAVQSFASDDPGVQKATRRNVLALTVGFVVGALVWALNP